MQFFPLGYTNVCRIYEWLSPPPIGTYTLFVYLKGTNYCGINCCGSRVRKR